MHIDFPLLLTLAVIITGALALVDKFYFAKRREQAVERYRQSVATPAPETLEQLTKQPAVLEFGRSLFPVLAFVFVLRSFLFEPFQIPSGSMIPTLQVGDFILVNKFSYGIRLPVIDKKLIPVGDPQRGDVMVFKYPEDPRINYIKRVVGVPGDHIEYTSNKRLVINGQSVAEQLIGSEPGSLGSAKIYAEFLGQAEHQIRKEMDHYRIEPSREWIVPEGHYFMLGDNRDRSKDSRYWDDPHISPELQGMVPDHYIVGKASAIWMTWKTPKFSHLPSFERAGFIQ